VYTEVDLQIGDAGRFATRTGRTIQLHPSGITFQVPQDWLEWDAQFHNNSHLSHRELRRVRIGHGNGEPFQLGSVQTIRVLRMTNIGEFPALGRSTTVKIPTHNPTHKMRCLVRLPRILAVPRSCMSLNLVRSDSHGGSHRFESYSAHHPSSLLILPSSRRSLSCGPGLGSLRLRVE
jgi:hypothetical protein